MKTLEKSKHLYIVQINIKVFQGLCYEYKFTVMENNNQTDQHSDCQLVMEGVVQGNAHILVQNLPVCCRILVR